MCSPGAELAARATPAPAKKAPAKAWTAPKTGWGDPDLSGVYTNNDESLIPFERPAEFAGRKLEDVTPAELEKLIDERDAQRAEADRNRAELRSPLHWFENLFPNNSRAWLVSDPPDGKVPAPTAEAQQRNGARARERAARGPADSSEDRSLYDRCISRGIPGSMMPAIYGNAYEIVQGPGYVAITYEMVHEARVIPLTSAPHVGEQHPDVHGRRQRPLGGQHARRRDDELHGQDRLSRFERAPQADGTLHAHRTGERSNGHRPSTIRTRGRRRGPSR